MPAPQVRALQLLSYIMVSFSNSCVEFKVIARGYRTFFSAFLRGLPGTTPLLCPVLLLGFVFDLVHFKDIFLVETVLLNVLSAESII